MASLKELKIQFLEYLEIESSALRTIENYDQYLARYFNFAKIKMQMRSPVTLCENSVFLNRQPVNKTGETMSRKHRTTI